MLRYLPQLFSSQRPPPQPRFRPSFPFLIGWQGLGWGWVRFQRIGLLQSHFQLLELNNGGEGVWVSLRAISPTDLMLKSVRVSH